MLCPVCLLFLVTSEANVQVDGTVFCGHHGVEKILQRPNIPVQLAKFTPAPPPAS